MTVLKEVMSTTLWVVWAITSFVVAMAGPFGTFSTQPFVWRLGYWALVIALAILIAISLRAFWRSVLSGRPTWQEDGTVASSLAILFGPMIVAVNRAFDGDTARETRGVGTASLCVFAIAVCVIFVRRTFEENAAQSNAVEQEVARDRLFDRIDAPEGQRLARIASDNHHIRVTTQCGSEHRVLMRLRDAVAEVDVEPGFCVHRSHWVAQGVIVGVTTQNGRELVELVCGAQVPVGPKYRNNLIEAGVLNA